MKVFVIGGTRFIGPYVVKQLLDQGHEVTLFHRGQTKAELPDGVKYLHGDKQHLSDYLPEIKAAAPDVVLEMMSYFERDALKVMNTFAGIAKRAVVLSSCDVYRAFGRVNGIEGGPVEHGTLDENAPLRTKIYPYRGIREGFDDYDKILVERIFMSNPELPGTVLRLPVVYGPGDYQHRMFAHLKRMMDKRPAILMAEDLANWHWSRGYVEDVAAAIVLAVTDERAAGQIYNVGETDALSMYEWVEQIGRAVEWQGRIVTVPAEKLPEKLKWSINTRQNVETDTSKIRRELGFNEQFSREEAFNRTARWEAANYPAEYDADQFDYELEDRILAQV